MVSGGRPRKTEAADRLAELYDVVLSLVREVGYESLTMDAVAQRAGVSKATLYRKWHGKPDLVVHAMKNSQSGSLNDVNTGSLRGDFEEMIRRCMPQTANQAALLRSLIHAAHRNRQLMWAMRDLLIEPQNEQIRVMLRRAVARGEVAAGNPALGYVPHMLIGGVTFRELVEDRAAEQHFVRAYVEAAILPALGL